MKYIATLIIIIIILLPACKTKDGPVTEYKGNVRIEGFYKEGLKDSCWEYYNEDNIKILVENYSSGKLNGKSYSWYPSGPKHTESDFINDTMVGIFRIWYLNGQLNSITTRDSAGVVNGESIIYYENGNLKQVGKFKNGSFHDAWTEYFENGRKENIKVYDNDIKTGMWVYFNEVGDTIRIEQYEKDSLIRIENFKVPNGD